MINFEKQAEELLSEAETFKRKRIEAFGDLIINKPDMDFRSGLTLNFITRKLRNSTQEKYTTQQISEILGIAEWKIRRYIASEKLKAESSKSSDGNPGRSGYSISKETLICFINQNSKEILAISTRLNPSFEQAILNFIKTLKNFIERIDSTIYLGSLELKVAELEQTEETIEILKKKIQFQKLNMEKQCFEEMIKNLESYLPEHILLSATEQNTET